LTIFNLHLQVTYTMHFLLSLPWWWQSGIRHDILKSYGGFYNTICD